MFGSRANCHLGHLGTVPRIRLLLEQLYGAAANLPAFLGNAFSPGQQQVLASLQITTGLLSAPNTPHTRANAALLAASTAGQAVAGQQVPQADANAMVEQILRFQEACAFMGQHRAIQLESLPLYWQAAAPGAPMHPVLRADRFCRDVARLIANL